VNKATGAAGAGGQTAASQVFLYFGPLTLLVYLSAPTNYLVDFATSYMLKDQLHATAEQVANFRLLTAIPTYFAVVFGLTRDLWNPFGLRDRGYFLIFAPLTAILFAWLAASKLSYGGLFVGMFLLMFISRFVSASYQGLIALIGQEKLMSGRLTALWQVVASIPAVLGALGGGWVADHLRPSETFGILAVIALLLTVYGLLKPGAVFQHAYDQPLARGANLVGDIKRLLKHRAIYPAVLIAFMFQFAPGSNTPLQYYLHDKLHASDAVYGEYYAVFAMAFVPMFFVYGWLCKRVPLNKLLWWGTIIAIPQMIPLALIHSAQAAVALALPIGMMGGIAAGAYFDLAMRSCPAGLQGTLMMLVESGFQLSYRGGDVLGAKIYASSAAHGFLYCALATTAVYALILPVLLLIPKGLIATADGEENPELTQQAQAAAGAS
jgi:MFS family permease